MRICTKLFMTAFALAACAVTSLADVRATAAGRVLDSSGRPLENAMVMVYSAGVKTGYSRFCPTCYRDCGKKTFTGADGKYAISGLDPELKFTLLAAKDGYLATWINRVDPAAGPAPDVSLKSQPDTNDVSRTVHGRVVDVQGEPVKSAVVQCEIAGYKTEAGKLEISQVNSLNLTLTNDKGEFDFATDRPLVEMTFRISAPGVAPRLFTAPAGSERKTIVLTEGVTIKGRLVYEGKPVASAEVKLVVHGNSPGQEYADVRIGTDDDGGFVITNVPPRRVWFLTPTMESLAGRGIGIDPVVCQTVSDGQIIDLGDIRLKRAFTLSGRVVLSGDKPVPPGMQVILGSYSSGDGQVAKIGSDGSFRFQGLPEGIYYVGPAVEGYRLPNDVFAFINVDVLVNGDVSDLVIKMEPIQGLKTN
jgi:protocatechuate 3,4-dioxygenase beta subunit